jgi:hypothetical protein
MAKRNGSFKIKVAGTINGRFVLELDKRQSITIAKKFLPSGIKKGDELIVEFYTPDQLKKRQQNLGEAVLKEILGE